MNIFSKKRLESDVKKQLVFDELKQLKFEIPNERMKYVEKGFTNDETHKYKQLKIDKKLEGLHRFLQINLAVHHSHLRETFVDYGPRVEAFWLRSGILPDERMVRKRKGLRKELERRNVPKEKWSMPDEKIWRLEDFCFQIEGRI